MASSEELVTTLSSHVSAAYDAVEAAGGIVPAGGNLSNLAGSIQTIPVTPEDIPNGYAVIEYYTTVTFGEWEVTTQEVPISADIATLTAFLTAHPPLFCTAANFIYEQDWETGNAVWWYRPDGYDPSTWVSMTEEEFTTETGITYEWAEPYMQITVARTVAVDTTSTVQTVTATTAADLSKLTPGNNMVFNGDFMATISGATFYVGAVKKVTIGRDATALPDNFCTTLPNLSEVVLFKSCNVTSIGANVFSGCPVLNSPIIVPAQVTSIGSYFLVNSAAFNSSVTLTGNATGFYYFMNNCPEMTATIDVGSNVAPNPRSGDYPMCVSSASAPAYTTGITLAGANAAAWKAALPDRTSNPYRKLILAS